MTSVKMGEPVRRVEDARLVIGQGSYGDDVRFPGEVFGFTVRTPHAHARVVSIDTSAARQVPGVLAVLTHADYLADGLKPLPVSPKAISPPEIRLDNDDGSPIFVPPFFPLAADRVRFVGEGVAWVVAETIDIAKEAAELVDITYDLLPASCDGRDAAGPGAERIWSASPSNVLLDATVGPTAEVAEAFRRARHVVGLETLIPRCTGAPMEARTATAIFDAGTGRVTLHAGGGSVTWPKRDLMHTLGLPAEQVRAVARDVGGNFGTRNYTFPEFVLTAWSARRLGRPVRWACERSESFMTDYHGRDLAVSAELALDEHGRILALRASNLSNVGAYPLSFVPLTKGTELMSSVYAVPVAAARARAVLTNTPPTVPYRSAGRPEVMFVMERLLDKAARAAGLCRIELRRRNFVPEAAMPYTNPFGMTYDSGAYLKAFDRALEVADVAGYPLRKASSEQRGRKRGLGFGCYIESASGFPQERSIVTVHPDGRVEVIIGTLSAGQGHETSFAQVVTEYLGVPFEAVRILTGDTDVAPIGGGSHSGRSMRHAATTISAASREIIGRARRVAALLLQTSEDDLAFEGAHFTTAGAEPSVSLFEVAKAMAEQSDLPDALRGPLTATADVHSTVASFPYGAHVSEVEVDIETGRVSIQRYIAVDDVGRAVNPLIVHGQTHGGIAQGAGEALMEECVYDSSGQMVSGSFMDYAMPRADDFPLFETDISEVPSTTHPLGLRGGGEGGITPTLAVIGNAIVDALSEYGVEHVELPATPQRVWRAIQQARRSGAAA